MNTHRYHACVTMVKEAYFDPLPKDPPTVFRIGAGHLFTIVGSTLARIEQNSLVTICALPSCQVVSDQEVVVTEAVSIGLPDHYPDTLGLRSCTEIYLHAETVLKTETGKKVQLVNNSSFLLQDPVHVCHLRFVRP